MDLVSHLPHLARGLAVTLIVWSGAAVLSLGCALLAGLGRMSSDVVLRCLASVYVEVFRGTSALVQLFWFYFALPMLLGVQWDALVVGIVVLGLNALRLERRCQPA